MRCLPVPGIRKELTASRTGSWSRMKQVPGIIGRCHFGGTNGHTGGKLTKQTFFFLLSMGVDHTQVVSAVQNKATPKTARWNKLSDTG